MLTENDKLRKTLGFDKWDDYTGSRVAVILGEDFESFPGGHGGQVYRTLLEFCTPGKVLYARMLSGDGQALITQTIPAIIASGACVCGASLASTNNDADGAQYDTPLEAVKDRCTLAMTGGYKSEGTYNVMVRSKYIDCVGAFYQDADTGKLSGLGYTGPEDQVDFCGPGYVWIPTISGGKELFPGNSAALPVHLAQRVRLQDYFIAKTGKPLGHEAMHRLLKDISNPLCSAGYDAKTGWGAPILPDPTEIDIWKYWEVTDLSKEYTDAETIPAYAKDSVALLTDLGIMQGNAKGEFMPTVTVDRSQLAVAVANLYKMVSGIG